MSSLGFKIFIGAIVALLILWVIFYLREGGNQTQQKILPAPTNSPTVSVTQSPNPSSKPTTPSSQFCQTNSDCGSNEICTQSGPIAIDPTTKKPINGKTCQIKGSISPL